MRFSRTAIALAASILVADAQSINGFNSGATFADGSVKSQSDFEAEFRAMQNLPGATCFNSVRLFTSIQGGSPNTPISAIPAAIATQTTILLGLWASAGQAILTNEIQAIQAAIEQYGSSFTDLVVGVSVGSEDLYRSSSIAAQQGNTLPGVEPTVLADYIGQVRRALSTTALSGAQIGHVDTWTSWVNGTVAPVIEAVDWLGMDAYPYFESTLPDNSIENANPTFYSALGNTRGAAGGKPVWVTETGWPHQGANSGRAVASTANAETYWKDVGCSLFGSVNTWWYILRDSGSPDPTFGILPANLGSPIFDLSCPAGSSGASVCGGANSTSSSSSSASRSATSSVASVSAPTSAAATSTASIDDSANSYEPSTSGTALPPSPSASADGSAAPYPLPSSTDAGSATGSAAPSASGAASATPTASRAASATTSYGGPAFTGAAGKVAASAGTGLLAIFGLVAAL